MNTQRLIESLDRFPNKLLAVIDQLDREDAIWKPEDGGWSILEVIAHLADEEREDFRKKLELTLRDPNIDWPPIDPEGWAVQREYNKADFSKTVARFVAERRVSMDWLRSLPAANASASDHSIDWHVAHHHPKLKLEIRAGDLLLAWATHDLLHLRQIVKRLYQIIQRDGGEFISRYAGEWTS